MSRLREPGVECFSSDAEGLGGSTFVSIASRDCGGGAGAPGLRIQGRGPVRRGLSHGRGWKSLGCKEFAAQGWGIFKHRGLAEDMFEFANVTRPCVLSKFVQKTRAQTLLLAVQLDVQPRQHRPSQQRDIPGSIAQRRQLYGEMIEPVKKVSPEFPGANTFG